MRSFELKPLTYAENIETSGKAEKLGNIFFKKFADYLASRNMD
jgi:hypothetical protein